MKNKIILYSIILIIIGILAPSLFVVQAATWGTSVWNGDTLEKEQNQTSENSACLPGYIYNPQTGQLCQTDKDPACLPGYLYSPTTGKPCQGTQNNGSMSSYTSSTFISSTTNNKTSPYLSRTLKIGMQGDDVKLLQLYLNTHNYIISQSGSGSPGNETTYFGDLTKTAVILFQKDNGLIADGIVGPKTIEKIK